MHLDHDLHVSNLPSLVTLKLSTRRHILHLQATTYYFVNYIDISVTMFSTIFQEFLTTFRRLSTFQKLFRRWHIFRKFSKITKDFRRRPLQRLRRCFHHIPTNLFKYSLRAKYYISEVNNISFPPPPPQPPLTESRMWFRMKFTSGVYSP